jgi:hypothetical protein
MKRKSDGQATQINKHISLLSRGVVWLFPGMAFAKIREWVIKVHRVFALALREMPLRKPWDLS